MESKTLDKFAPLAGVFSIVLITTALITSARSDYALMSMGKTFMGVFFLTFGGFKAYNLSGFKEAFQMYDLVARRSELYATIYPLIELALGFSYLYLSFNSIRTLEIATHSVTSSMTAPRFVRTFFMRQSP